MDPETGQWVVESSSRRSSRSSSPRRQEEKSRHSAVKSHSNTQVCRNTIGRHGRQVVLSEQGKKARKDKKKEWDLAKQMWGKEEAQTPVKQKKSRLSSGNLSEVKLKKKKSSSSDLSNKENIPEPGEYQAREVRRSGREVKKVHYIEASESSQSQ